MNIFRATEQGDLRRVKQLINEGVDINVVDMFGHTPLTIAVQSGNLKIAEVLIAAGADVNSDHEGLTPLIHASFLGLLDMAKLLVANGAHVNHRDDRGDTALMFASRRGSLKLVQFLVLKGADVNMEAINQATNTEVRRFLEKVARNGYIEDFQRIGRNTGKTILSRQAQLEKVNYPPNVPRLPGDVANKIARLSLTSFGKKKSSLIRLKRDLGYILRI